jgi:hypothetical protein
VLEPLDDMHLERVVSQSQAHVTVESLCFVPPCRPASTKKRLIHRARARAISSWYINLTSALGFAIPGPRQAMAVSAPPGDWSTTLGQHGASHALHPSYFLEYIVIKVQHELL